MISVLEPKLSNVKYQTNLASTNKVSRNKYKNLYKSDTTDINFGTTKIPDSKTFTQTKAYLI